MHVDATVVFQEAQLPELLRMKLTQERAVQAISVSVP